MPQMTTRIFGKNPFIVMAVQTQKSPSNAEWGEYLTCVERAFENASQQPHGVRGLVITDGGAPGLLQRAQLNQILRGRAVAGAVISASPLVRAAVKGLNAFNP